jgi:two-component system phosphate regulon response regulator PhoB
LGGGESYPVTASGVDIQMVSLRKKLGKFGAYIETGRGVGYRFFDEPKNRANKPFAA